MGASWQAFYAHLCAASIIRAMPETEIPPPLCGGIFIRYLRGGALSYKLTTPSVCSLHSHPPPSTGRLNVEVCTVPKGATIYGGAVERSETEGEHLAALASSELFPFQLLITFAATFPVNGDSFWVCNTMCQFSPCCIPRSGRSASAPSPANLVARGLGR